MLEGYSFGVLGPNNWLRVTLLQTLQHRHFENFILVLILLSSLTLALQMPSLDRDAILYQVLNVMDMVFVVLFALEAAMKGLVKGFLFNGRDSYLQNAWNILDFLIVIIGEAGLEHRPAVLGRCMCNLLQDSCKKFFIQPYSKVACCITAHCQHAQQFIVWLNNSMLIL